MNPDRRKEFDEEVERLQGLLTVLEGLGDSTARSAAQELLQVVLGLHGDGLSELIGIIEEAGDQPADLLMPRFAANPAVRGLLLLHDLHPEDLETRASQAVERLRPHFGVRGFRADVVAVESDVVRVAVSPTGQVVNRPPASELKHEIEQALLEVAPDAADIVFEGLDETGGSSDSFVPITAIERTNAAGK